LPEADVGVFDGLRTSGLLVWVVGAAIEPAIVIDHGRTDPTFVCCVSVGGESTGPGDVAMAGRVG